MTKIWLSSNVNMTRIELSRDVNMTRIWMAGEVNMTTIWLVTDVNTVCQLIPVTALLHSGHVAFFSHLSLLTIVFSFDQKYF